MIQKNEFPILEYDFDSTEILKPNHGAEQLLDKFCTRRIPLQMQSSMMTVTGERIRCGKRWNSV